MSFKAVRICEPDDIPLMGRNRQLCCNKCEWMCRRDGLYGVVDSVKNTTIIYG